MRSPGQATQAGVTAAHLPPGRRRPRAPGNTVPGRYAASRWVRTLGPCSDATRPAWWTPKRPSRAGTTRCPSPTATTCSAPRCRARSPRAPARRSSPWAASGAPSASSGQLGAGIVTTAVGYAGGHTPNPSYEEVCSGRTGHTEVVLVAYDPTKISYETLLACFWEDHDPTPGHAPGQRRRHPVPLGDLHRRRRPGRRRQGQPRHCTRSGSPAAGHGEITTEIRARRRRARPCPSSTRSRTTSSTCRRTRWATAASAAPGCPARSASPADRSGRRLIYSHCPCHFLALGGPDGRAAHT